MIPRTVQSPQSDPHAGLEARVRKHRDSHWRQPIRRHSRQAFQRIVPRVRDGVAVVLDSGCGTGASTAALAKCHPDALVVGLDRSAVRLARAPRNLPDNAVLVRALLEDFWRLAADAGWPVTHHYLLYPNPWPKPRHLGRRWHAHPTFPSLLGLGGRLELRTNWPVYAREFAMALDIHGIAHAGVVSFHPEDPLTPFERKYAAAGHALYRLAAQLEQDHEASNHDNDSGGRPGRVTGGDRR